MVLRNYYFITARRDIKVRAYGERQARAFLPAGRWLLADVRRTLAVTHYKAGVAVADWLGND